MRHYNIGGVFYRQSGVDTTLGTKNSEGRINDTPILASEYGSRRTSQKKPLWDSSKTYSPKGFTFRDVRLMPYYHAKIT